MQGWIKLHRKVLDNYLFQEKRTFSKFEAWTYLLLSANHKEHKFLLGSELLTVKSGQVITSETKLMKRFNWSKSKLRRFLSLLESDNMIERKTDTKKTTLTLVNYEVYQQQETTKKPRKDHKGTKKGLQKDTIKNEENDKQCFKNGKEQIDEVFSFFNLNHNKMPKIISIKENRKTHLESRLKDHGLETVKEAILKASESKFLNGENERKFTANFDWILKPANFTKILEGNYKNRADKQKLDKNR